MGEVKGDVSCPASQSSEGTVCRGNLAACLSGPEKSRHLRHVAVGAAEGVDNNNGILGFVAIILDRSGRDDIGIGGGMGFGAVSAT